MNIRLPCDNHQALQKTTSRRSRLLNDILLHILISGHFPHSGRKRERRKKKTKRDTSSFPCQDTSAFLHSKRRELSGIHSSKGFWVTSLSSERASDFHCFFLLGYTILLSATVPTASSVRGSRSVLRISNMQMPYRRACVLLFSLEPRPHLIPLSGWVRFGWVFGLHHQATQDLLE